MANNRTEATTAVNTQMVPEIDAPELRNVLNVEMIDSLVFRKDVIASETPGGGLVTADFSNKDLATFTTAGDLVVSFSNIENGDVKTLGITKNVTDEITFSGATDVSPRKAYIISDITYVEYEVRNKNGIITVNSKNIDNDISSELGQLLTKVVNIGDWDMNTTGALTVAHGLSDNMKVRRVTALIRDDANTSVLPIDTKNVSGLINGGIGSVGAVNVGLYRENAALFDSSSFQNTSYNRGWIVIDYIR